MQRPIQKVDMWSLILCALAFAAALGLDAAKPAEAQAAERVRLRPDWFAVRSTSPDACVIATRART
jgi:hypothetical protein